MTVRFLLLPLPGFTLLPFAAFVDKLRFSSDEADHSRQHYCRWLVAAPQPQQRSSCGVVINAEPLPHTLTQFDYVVLFGGRPTELTAEQQLPYRSLLRNFSALNRPLAAIDNSVFLLAQLGLLNGRKVAVHWRHQPQFSQRFPHLEIAPESLYYRDGNRLSCAGGSAAADLAVALLQPHLGRVRANKGLADMLIDGHRSPQQPQPKESTVRQCGDTMVNRATALMLNQLAQPLSIPQLAKQLGLSRRQLDRRFQQQYQRSAAGHYLWLRLNHADWLLLNSDWSLPILADACGFCSPEHLSRQYQRQFSLRPSQRRTQDRDQAEPSVNR
ncbi:helix-turn-helix domain-containing protein [uncultured Ferrimonas sp.]|uniref:GlxA family transcriptional regulator n=1 Tax=uncultured Ferrimonas sp. TaxID=432640 RepID=UPI00263A3B88|nr:helix-turn-helix domain-containing protein [uncultured Ferrimonas sp.]